MKKSDDEITYWLPAASFTLYGDVAPKYKWIMSTYKIYLHAWRVYIPIYFEVMRVCGVLFCIKNHRAILRMVGATFVEIMVTPPQKES